MSKGWMPFFFLIVLLGAAASAAAQAPDCSFVPGWKQHGEARHFVPDNLFDYMNGNAEGYLVFHFVELKGVTCRNAGGDSLVVDVYEMESPDFAFGIFMTNRDPRQPMLPLGMRAQVLSRKALLAKGKYYLELSAEPVKDHSEMLKAALTALEKKVEGRTTPPPALDWFPKEKLVADSVRMVPQSVLGIGMLKAGYVGQYEFGKGFLVPEETPDSARQVLAKLKGRLEGLKSIQAGEEGYCGTDRYLDGLCVFRKGSVLGGFAGVKNGQNVEQETARFAGSVKP